MNLAQPVRLGLIGAGNVVETYHLPALSGLSDLRISWIYDKDVRRAELLADAADIARPIRSLEEAPDVDLVLVAVPVGARRAVLTPVFARGWHAFCEKPFAATLRDHEEFVAAARKRGIRLGVGLVRRQYTSTQTARKLLEAGLLGPIEEVLAGEGSRVRRTGKSSDWYQASAQESGGGVLFETGSHLIDQVFTVCGVESFRIERCRQRVWEGLEFETSVGGRLDLGHGQDVPFAFVVTRLHDTYNGIVVHCRNGQVRLGLAPDATVEIRDRDGNAVGGIPARLTGSRSLFGALQAEWQEFAAACARSSDFSDWDTGLLTTGFIDECYRLGARIPATEVAQGGA